MSNRIHMLGIPHTIVHEDYTVCAFTAKILLFPDVIQPYGWEVIEYSNEGSASNASRHVTILSSKRFKLLSKRRSRQEPHDADVNNAPLQQEFQRSLLEKITKIARPGDIVCHVWGPNMEVFNRLPQCHHLESSVGYLASPGLPFRVYESSAWMHWHYGKAGQEDGNNYKWVVPSAFDENRWPAGSGKGDYVLYMGRVTPRKGIETLIEVARRMPEQRFLVYGPGDTSQWAAAPANVAFMGSAFGDERVQLVQNARCVLMPTLFIEPFGFSGIEAQLCGTPLIASAYGAFHETVIEHVTGYRCHTLADWVEAIKLSDSLDRGQIASLARQRYSKAVVGQQYDWIFRQLQDLSGRGWYAETSRKFGSSRELQHSESPAKPRIYLFSPYFGKLPNYFQFYLDSLAVNQNELTVFLPTDIDLSGYDLPDNLVPLSTTFDEFRQKIADFLNREFALQVQPSDFLKSPYKLCDFKIVYPKLFQDVLDDYGITPDDFVGWGDCDLIFGKIADFLDTRGNYQIIGGYHGHFTAFKNTDAFKDLFHQVDDLPNLLISDTHFATDEIAFREPLLSFLADHQYPMFYINRYFCDIVPSCYFGMFRQDHAEREKNFFDAYNPQKDISYIDYDDSGALTIQYDDGSSRKSIYCHLQKRQIAINVDNRARQYRIHEASFDPLP